ncbi:MAG: 16S rRNA (cytosine(967)-C(5))-methyltransferase RsmB [Planctomycetes bacterium]|nr:16S rRNA (cytosine(967)-C(5))-methyltransferase RsmB [Planctomycetota bacterium]
MVTAREFALSVLLAAARADLFVADELDERLERAELSPEDRALATTLVYGVVRQRGTLDWLIGALATRGLGGTDKRLLEILRIGAFQLLFLERVPAYAVVNEAVKAAQEFAGRHAGSFVNGLLRGLDRKIEARGVAEEGEKERSLPHPEGGFVRLKEPLLPAEGKEPAAALAVRYSHPRWLVERWLRGHGRATAERLCAAGNVRPEICVRANRLRITRAELAVRLAAEGAAARLGSEPDALYLEKAGRLPRLASFGAGLFAVQDEAAQVVAPLAGVRPGERVLDLCAAPGGKTAHLAALMGDRGLIVACDRSRARLAPIAENVRRLGLTCVALCGLDGRHLPFRRPASFDVVLVDAPCSNTGVLARRVEARWRVTEAELVKFAALQGQLLAAAAACVRVGGALVYSTCSIEPEENREQIGRFLEGRREFVLEEERLLLPEAPRGGGYVARLRKG